MQSAPPYDLSRVPFRGMHCQISWLSAPDEVYEFWNDIKTRSVQKGILAPERSVAEAASNANPAPADRPPSSVTPRMRTSYFAAPSNGIKVILDMPPECVLLTEHPCAIFECK